MEKDNYAHLKEIDYTVLSIIDLVPFCLEFYLRCGGKQGYKYEMQVLQIAQQLRRDNDIVTALDTLKTLAYYHPRGVKGIDLGDYTKVMYNDEDVRI